jgi:hypothetical protein
VGEDSGAGDTIKAMKCEDCKYFDDSEVPGKEYQEPDENYYGNCRRNAPLNLLLGLVGTSDRDFSACFPFVNKDLDWCGEFESKKKEEVENIPNGYESAFYLNMRLGAKERSLNKWGREGKIPCLILPNGKMVFNYEEVVKALKRK